MLFSGKNCMNIPYATRWFLLDPFGAQPVTLPEVRALRRHIEEIEGRLRQGRYPDTTTLCKLVIYYAILRRMEWILENVGGAEAVSLIDQKVKELAKAMENLEVLYRRSYWALSEPSGLAPLTWVEAIAGRDARTERLIVIAVGGQPRTWITDARFKYLRIHIKARSDSDLKKAAKRRVGRLIVRIYDAKGEVDTRRRAGLWVLGAFPKEVYLPTEGTTLSKVGEKWQLITAQDIDNHFHIKPGDVDFRCINKIRIEYETKSRDATTNITLPATEIMISH